MAISSKNGSKRVPVSSSSSSKSKVKERVREIKAKLSKKRLMNLTTMQKNMLEQRDPGSMDKPMICYQPKEEEINFTMQRAQEVQANLLPQFPSFVKLMRRSHVTVGFWLGLPKPFCHAHLPKKDGKVVLMDENEQEYDTKYLVDKTGLSGGWRGFSIAHKLLEGDALIFQLIKPCMFKLYIVRAGNLPQVDGAMSLPNLDSYDAKPIKTGQQEEYADVIETMRDKYLEPIVEDIHQKKDMGTLVSISELAPDKSDEDDNSDNLKTKSMGFQDFSIQVNGVILDSKIPKHVKTKYYDLCRSQNMFLHGNLMKGLDKNLAAGVILETIDIADKIRAVDSSTCPDDLLRWDKTLKALEDLGMVVGFLRARIHKLLSLYRECRAGIRLKITERAEAVVEVRDLIAKLEDAKTRIANVESEIRALHVKNEGLGSLFKEIACAPW